MVFSNNLLMGAVAASSGGGLDSVWVPKGAIWFERGSDYLTRTPSGAGNRKTFSLSCWIKMATLSADQTLWNAAPSGTGNEDMFIIRSSNIPEWMGAGYTYSQATRVLRDPTAWYHILFVRDSTNTVVSNRALMWINGEPITNTAGNTITLDSDATYWNNTNLHSIGNRQHSAAGPSSRYGGYLSEAIQLDGYAATPSDFGKYNVHGVWVPVDPTDIVTAQKGTTGFWLDFADHTDLGNDVSGNNNDWALTGIDASNDTADRCADDNDNNVGNYCTITTLFTREASSYSSPAGSITTSKGALTVDFASGGTNPLCITTQPLLPGNKYHFEWETNAWGSDALTWAGVWLIPLSTLVGLANINASGGKSYYTSSWNPSRNVTSGTNFNGVTLTTLAAADSWGVGEVLSLDVDMSTIGSTDIIYKLDGTTKATDSSLAFNDEPYFICPQVQSNSGNRTWNGTYNFGQTTFATTPETDHGGVLTTKISEPTIKNGEDNFSPILFEGNGTGQRVGNFIPFTDSHTVGNSARLDEGSTQYLTRSTWGTSTDTTKWTMSFWLKRATADKTAICTSGPDTSNQTIMQFDANNRIDFQLYVAPNYGRVTTSQVFTGTSGWMNIIFVHDSSNGTANDKMRIYINGVRATDFAQNDSPSGNYSKMTVNGANTVLGYDLLSTADAMDGYMSEVIFVDGYALDASPFGQTDTSTGRWIPKEVTAATLNTAGGGSSGFGTNGFYLNMADKNDLGDDESPNTNDFTETNMDTTNGSNQMYDTPTRNFNVLNPADSGGGTLAEGNLKITPANLAGIRATIGIGLNTGKYYWESLQGAAGGEVGWYSEDCNVSTSGGGQSNGAGNWNINFNGRFHANPIGGTLTTSSDQTAWAFTTGDVIMCAYDSGTGNLWFGKNGTWFDAGSGASGDTGNPSTGANPFLTGVNTKIFPMVGDGTGTAANIQTVNFGSWIYFDSTTLSLSTDPDGYFRHTVPTDFKAINQDNLPANTAGITGFSWIKNRDADDSHILADRVRGIGDYWESNDTTNPSPNSNSVQRFLQQGVQVGNMDAVNTDGESYVLWQWANNGTETDVSAGGTNVATTYRANTTAGFSNGIYTGDGNSGATVSHGLGAIPDFIIVKNTDQSSQDTNVYHSANTTSPATQTLSLNDSAATSSNSTKWNNGSPAFSTTTFTIGDSSGVNVSSSIYRFYAWAEIEGYSQFGKYLGNGNADGPVINLGFTPSFVLIKATERSNNWHIFDSARNPYNQITNDALFPDLDLAEGGTNAIDFGSNFFKLRTAQDWLNSSSSNNYIYAAFASNPFGGSGVNQAKAR